MGRVVYYSGNKNTPVYDGIWKYNPACTDLHQLASLQDSGGGQELVVVLSGEFSFHHVSLHLPCALRWKHTMGFYWDEQGFVLLV